MTDSRRIQQPIRPGVAAAGQPPAALRSALVGAIGRRRRRLRLRAAIAAGVCVAVGAVLFGGGVLTSGPERVLAIDDSGGEWVKISILDGEAGAAEMTRELQEAGIDGEVQLVPAVPQFVGHWMGIKLGNGDPCDLKKRRLEQKGPKHATCLLPVFGGYGGGLDGDVFEIRRALIEGDVPGPGDYELKTPVTLYVGREPEAGETPTDAPPLGAMPIGDSIHRPLPWEREGARGTRHRRVK
jgi:hypothetical protein